MTPRELKRLIKKIAKYSPEACPMCESQMLIKTLGSKVTQCPNCKHIFIGQLATLAK